MLDNQSQTWSTDQSAILVVLLVLSASAAGAPPTSNVNLGTSVIGDVVVDEDGATSVSEDRVCSASSSWPVIFTFQIFTVLSLPPVAKSSWFLWRWKAHVVKYREWHSQWWSSVPKKYRWNRMKDERDLLFRNQQITCGFVHQNVDKILICILQWHLYALVNILRIKIKSFSAVNFFLSSYDRERPSECLTTVEKSNKDSSIFEAFAPKARVHFVWRQSKKENIIYVEWNG